MTQKIKDKVINEIEGLSHDLLITLKRVIDEVENWSTCSEDFSPDDGWDAIQIADKFSNRAENWMNNLGSVLQHIGTKPFTLIARELQNSNLKL